MHYLFDKKGICNCKCPFCLGFGANCRYVVFRNGKDTVFIHAQEKVAYIYKHRFGIFRFYEELPDRAYSHDEESDLMEQIYKVSLTGYGKEVQYTMSLMERLEEQKRVNEEQERKILEKDKMIEELRRMVAELQGKHQLS